MVGPALIPPSTLDPEVDYVPSAEVLAGVPEERSGAIDRASNSEFSGEIPSPVLRAAVMPDIRILRGLLHHRRKVKVGANDVTLTDTGSPLHTFPPTSYMAGPLYGPWKVALSEAIIAGLPDHARLLLAYGACPDGFPLWCFQVASRRFGRDRPRALTTTEPLGLQAGNDVDYGNSGGVAVIAQAHMPMTADELTARRRPGVTSRFWAEEDFPRIDGYPTNSPTSALVAAIHAGDLNMYQVLVDNGADESFWKMDCGHEKDELRERRSDGGVGKQLPEDVSFWSVESPLAAAIKREDEDAVRFLLDREHAVDSFPAVLTTRSMNPLMLSIAKPTGPWQAGFDSLWNNNRSCTLDVPTTPIFRCHLLHFAVATLDIPTVKHVLDKMVPVSVAPAESETRTEIPANIMPLTTLGHTLLHIASLPRDDTVIAMQRPAVHVSVHDVRTLGEDWTSRALSRERDLRRTRGHTMYRRVRSSGGFGMGRGGLVRVVPGEEEGLQTTGDVPVAESRAQAEVLLYLLQRLGKSQIWNQDDHGNTILHYLSAVHNPDPDLIRTLITFPGGTRAYTELKNLWGFTAADLIDRTFVS
jgi:hypothetical protein